MIKIVLGKSKTGKTTHIYNEIKEEIDSKKNVILFVPSQCRAKAENEYMKILNLKGVMGVDITTISEYVKEELKIQNMHIDEKYLSKLDRKVILTQVIKENPELFNIFKRVKNYPGFLDVLDIYMDLFRKAELEPSQYENIEIKNKRTEDKFKEILNIYGKYIEKIKANYIDSVDEMQIFLENFHNIEFFKDKKTRVYIDGYNNFTNNEFKLIDRLMKEGYNITITLNTDISRVEDIYANNTSSIFETTNETYLELLKLANKNNCEVENIVKAENKFNCAEDIKYLANNLFETEKIKAEKEELKNVEVVMHTNVLKEIEMVARVISSKIKEGYRYSDFGIYTTNVDEYYQVISRAFYENNIEVYASISKPITDSILVKYIQAILNLGVRGLNLELIFEILKLGLTDIELKDIYILENYMREFNVNKYLVRNKFTLNNHSKSYDLDRLNEIKEQIVDMYSFVEELKGTSTEIIEKIYEHLKENNIFKNFEEMVTPIKNDAINLNMNNFEMQIWDAISSVFDSIVKVYAQEEIDIEEFRDVFNLVAKDIKIKTLPPTKDQVELMDINVSKTEPKKIAFFIGVCEGKFPKAVSEDIFFADEELEALKDKNIEIRETSLSKLNMGYFNIYEALNNIEEKLYVYIPSSTLDGKATRKSSFIILMEQVASFKIDGQVTKTEDNTDIFNMYSKEELFMWLTRAIRAFDTLNEEEKEHVISVYEYFKKDEKYNNILNFKKDDSNLSQELVDMIYSDEFKTSVSKLELYQKCPFSYFMQYVLKINPNKEAQVNVLELGSFMHGVLENYSKVLLSKNMNWSKILTEDLENIDPEYEKLLEEIIEDAIEENLSKQKQSVRYVVLKQKLANTMRKVIKTIALTYNQSEFEPYGYEIEFKDGSAFLPMEIQVAENRTMKLIGKIDRVDMLKTQDAMYVRVIDYKSSGKELKLDKIKEGISLQLITYLISFMENKKEENIKPAGMLYFNLSDKLLSLAQYESSNEKIRKELIKKLRMNGIFLNDVEILNKMDRNFEKNNAECLIDISTRSLGGKSSKALIEEDFKKLCDDTKITLQNIGKSISSGRVKICPNMKADACKYCNYSATCRKNIEV